MDAAHDVLARQTFGRSNCGPFALGESESNILLDQVTLLWRNLETLLHGSFGTLDLLPFRQHTSNLLECRDDI